MVSVILENVMKTFGKVIAVDDMNLHIEDGEFMALLGPSGCGKTTTLRLIAGLERVTRGRILFDDKVMDDGGITYVAPRFRKVSMVFQSYALFPHMRVFDNIAFPAAIAKIPKDEIRKRVHEVASLFGIEGLLDRKPHELSSGQQQRVALARALVLRPEVLLLDEPLANLDAKLRVAARAELKRLHKKEFKCTTIYVTHDQIEALSMADRIAVMNEGRIQQVGTPEDLYDRPENLFVAGFIGSPPMNLLECSFREEGCLLDFGPFTVKVPESWVDLLREHSELVFGIRPTDIAVCKRGEARGLRFEVYVTEALGDRIIVTLENGGVLVKTVAPPRILFEIGEEVRLVFNMNKAHIFDKKTGKIIL